MRGSRGTYVCSFVYPSIHPSVPPGSLRPEIGMTNESPPVFYRTLSPSGPLPCFLSLQFTIMQSRATGITDHILPLGDLLLALSSSVPSSYMPNLTTPNPFPLYLLSQPLTHPPVTYLSPLTPSLSSAEPKVGRGGKRQCIDANNCS